MSVFRFEATPTSSKPLSKRTKGKNKDVRGPAFAFSTSPSLLQDITLDKSEIGIRNTASSGLTMKEYEEQLKKLTAENFNLKLRVYFVEERLSKVTGVSDKEDLIKKNIQLKVTCESQLKELEKKQELLFEASKAFELLQKEHAEELEKLLREKDKDISELEEKLTKWETAHAELKARFPNLENVNDTEAEIRTLEEYRKQVNDLESNLREEEGRYGELEHLLKDTQLELESYQLKTQRLESELEQRMRRIDELVDELEQKEHDLAGANFRIRKLEDELRSKQREEEIMKERIEEKNKTIDSLKNSLASRDTNIEMLENKMAKERSSSQSLQSKLDSLSFQNSRLKEELEILQSRLRRNAESLSPRGKLRPAEEDGFKQKYEEVVKAMDEQEMKHAKRVKELEEKLTEKDGEAEDYQELFEKHKKLEDDHRKACTALKNFIKRSSEEKKEREALNHMLNTHEEVIADLKAQLDRYRTNSVGRLSQDDELSLAETGDNEGISGRAAPDNDGCLRETAARTQPAFWKPDKRENSLEQLEERSESSCEADEKPDGFSEFEADAMALDRRSEHKSVPDAEDAESTKELLASELENKKFEIEKLNGELKRRNVNLQEVVNRELWDKNRHIERLEKRLAEIGDANRVLRTEIDLRDQKLRILQAEEPTELPPCLLEVRISPDVSTSESLNSVFAASARAEGERRPAKVAPCSQGECARAKEQEEKADAVRKEAAEVCSLLSLRLEELAAFLDSLLTTGDLAKGISPKKSQDIRQAMEKSRELSRHLSLSFAKRHSADTSRAWSSLDLACGGDGFSLSLGDSFSRNDSLAVLVSRDKVISEQAIIINKLRDQLKLLSQEIKQRDIELSHCQGVAGSHFDDDSRSAFDDQGIEEQSLSICREVSDDEDEDDGDDDGDDDDDDDDEEDYYYEEGEGDGSVGAAAGEKGPERRAVKQSRAEKPCKSVPEDQRSPPQETSESEAWSEPDRSVSLARMGRLEDASLNISHRNSKCGDESSESSEGTLNENSKIPGKRGRSTESEIRRLHSRIKALDEVNENLRLENDLLKSEKMDSGFPSRFQKNEEANLLEKLRKTMDRLDECGLTCRQLEEKLAVALERASSSAMQLSKAQETISVLEQEISQLRDEIATKNLECDAKTERIKELETKLEQAKVESEARIAEALKQKESAERKTLEVECRLKDAENMSREVESRVNEIEKKISETKKFKKETVMHFKEAEKHVDTAEKMMEEAERMKLEAERKSKDFQNFIDLMRKEVEEKLKEAEKRVKKSEKEKEDLEKQVAKLKKRLLEAEKNKAEVETKVKEGKETIQCMEEKLRELEVAMDQCGEEAQRKIKEMQKKADAKVAELEMKIEERDWVRKAEGEKKMAEAEKISKELEVGFRKQLEDAEKKVRKAKENAEAAVRKVQEEAKAQEADLRQKILELEAKRAEECRALRKQLDEAKLEASELELELTKLTNEKIHLEEELTRLLDKESALVRDNREIKGKYETSIRELEGKLTQLTLNKSQLASRLEEIESTNFDLVSRISALRGKETTVVEHEFISALSPPFTPPHHGVPGPAFFGDFDFAEATAGEAFARLGSATSDPGDQLPEIPSAEAFVAPPRRNLNSSPDLGIESDPGRFSSLEASHQTGGRRGASPAADASELKKLETENVELRRRLVRTRQALEETLTQLSAANHRKKQVEKAICKQLHKTHHILKKARVNFESQDGDALE